MGVIFASLSPATATTLSPAATLIVGVIRVFVVFFVVLFFFLFVLAGQRIRFRDLTQIWQLNLISANETLLYQFLEFGDEDILDRNHCEFLPIAPSGAMPTTYLDHERIFVGLRFGTIVGLRIVWNL